MPLEHPAWDMDVDCDEITNTSKSPESIRYRQIKKKATKDKMLCEEDDARHRLATTNTMTKAYSRLSSPNRKRQS